MRQPSTFSSLRIALLATALFTCVLVSPIFGEVTTPTAPASAGAAKPAWFVPRSHAASEALRKAEWPELETTGDPKQGQAVVDALGANVEAAWLGTSGGLNIIGLQQAARVFFRIHQTAPQDIQELAPYCFAWPLASRDSSYRDVPIIESASTLPKFGQAWERKPMGGLKLLARVSEDSLEIARPVITRKSPESPEERVYHLVAAPLELALPRGEKSSRPSTVPAVPASTPPVERNFALMAYLQHTVQPHDARLDGARETLSGMIQLAARRSGKFPDNLNAIQLDGGARFEQLQQAQPDKADIVIEFDGRQAYRYTLRLSNGEVLRWTEVYFALHPMDAAAVAVPDGQVPDRADAPFMQIASLRLRPAAKSLPPQQLSAPGNVGNANAPTAPAFE